MPNNNKMKDKKATDDTNKPKVSTSRGNSSTTAASSSSGYIYSYNPADYVEFNKRTRGVFSQKIFDERLASGEGFFGDAFKMELIVEMCGLYEKGTILNNVDIVFFTQNKKHDETEFYVRHKRLSEQDREFLNVVPDIKVLGRTKLYQSNPLNAEIGLKKLYHDPRTDYVHRCVIDDIYCGFPKGQTRALHLLASITLIDLGQSMTCEYKQIYDYSLRSVHLMDIKPEALSARLYLPGTDSARASELHKLLKDTIINNNESVSDKKYSIKILGYKNKIYEVDVITDPEVSFINSNEPNAANAECEKQQAGGNSSSAYDMSHFSEVLPSGRHRRATKILPRRRFDQNPRKEVPPPNFIGAQQYFMTLLRRPFALGTSYVSNRLVKVMLLDWYEPDQLAILPYDKLGYHFPSFIAKLNSLKCVQQAGDLKNKIEKKVYKPGEFIFFKNVFYDDDLGPWLRGVVVSLSCYNCHNLVIAQQRTDQAKLENYYTMLRLVDDGKVHPDDIVYRVRSVDYGCEARSSPLNMRTVTDMREFKSVGTWSIRCTLFGIYPFDHDKGEFAEHSKDVFDSWIRHRYIEDDTGFRVLFRSYIEGQDVESSFDKLIEISLFHRFDPPHSEDAIVDLFKPKLARYSCLNWHLVDQGLVSAHDKNNINSSVQLEDYVVQQLERNRKL